MVTRKTQTPRGGRRQSDPQKRLLEAQEAGAGLRRVGATAPSAAGEDALQEVRALRAAAWQAEHSLQGVRGLVTSLTGVVDLEVLSRRILSATVRILRSERAALFLGGADASGLVPVAAVGIDGEDLQVLERVSRTVLRAWKKGDVFITHDAFRDPALAEVRSVKLNEIHSILLAPLAGTSGLIGALYVDAESPDAFPPDAERLVPALAEIAAAALENARAQTELRIEAAQLRQRSAGLPPGPRFGSGEAARQLSERARVAAWTDSPLLIRGEPGTGRSFLARSIHQASGRGFRPFVDWNCAAAPLELQRGLVLGRTGVAATGAFGEDAGVLEQLAGGSLLLSDAHGLDLELAESLAEILESGFYRPMGGRRDVRVSFRLMLATDQDLAEQAKADQFSSKLFARAEGLTIWIPPLRERPEDIPEMAGALLRRAWSDLGPPEDRRSECPRLSPAALARLAEHPWPGNLRELESVLRRALLLTQAESIEPDVVEQAITPPRDEDAIRQGPWSGRVMTLTEWEKEAIRQAMIQTRGNMSQAAHLLGIHRNTLVRKLREYSQAD